MSTPWPNDLEVGNALLQLRRLNALPLSPADAENWSFKVGSVVVTLPNFCWRRQAIDRHDLHHVLINQPCNLKGECQVAIWEFAAGAYPNIWPRLFCLPLVAAGFIISPADAWRMFKSGRRQRSLYGTTVENVTRLGELRDYVEDRNQRCGSPVPGCLQSPKPVQIEAPHAG